MSAAINHSTRSEVAILARVLGNGERPMPATMARCILQLRFSQGDRSRMHDLAQRNQENALSEAEQEELLAYSKAGTLLSILKSKARRTLQMKTQKRTSA